MTFLLRSRYNLRGWISFEYGEDTNRGRKYAAAEAYGRE
jgi:hypothetical protein